MHGDSEPATLHRRAVQVVLATLEAAVLALACLSPWAFGGIDAEYRGPLLGGVGVLLLLWGLRVLLEGRLSWKRCPVALCTALLFLFGIAQLLPLPRATMERLSPATARMYDQLLPAHEEEVGDAAPRQAAPRTPGSTLSLYPGGTRTTLVNLLAILLFFLVVRYNLATPEALRRLSVALLINGFALSLFALIQFFTSKPDTVYWKYRTEGTVFGPFVCRNHFPYYLNLCIGLGAGLLLAVRTTHSRRERSGEYGREPQRDFDHGSTGRRSGSAGKERAERGGLFALLQQPGALWIVTALVFMVASVVLSLSRGGVLAMLGSAAVCLVLRIARSRRPPGVETGGLVVVLALALVTWIGWGGVAARWESLVARGDVVHEARVPLWQDLVPIAEGFPVWGTGYGTFAYVEPLHRADNASPDLEAEHAHNEYLEALIEGGAVRLVLTLVGIGLVYVLGYRALRHYEGRSASGLVLGALFGFTAVVLHSAADFGIHIPAVALLTAAVAAHLCSLGSRSRHRTAAHGAATGEQGMRLGCAGPVALAAGLVVVGVCLGAEGWKVSQANRFREAAARLKQEVPPLAQRERQVELLTEAVRLAPENARLRTALGDAHRLGYEQELARLQRAAPVADLTQFLAAGLEALSGGGNGATLSAFGPAQREVWQGSSSVRAADLRRQHLVPALVCFLRARDECPLLAEPHMRLAGYTSELRDADPRAAYLRRAELLRPTDPELWYTCGLVEFRAGDREGAWTSWHRSLELSDRYLKEVLGASVAVLKPGEILERVLPDRPRILLKAARSLYPDSAPNRRPFVEKALTLLEHAGPQSAEDYHNLAELHGELGHRPEAIKAFQAALGREPMELSWRYALAELLYEEGRLAEAKQELQFILGHQENARAAQLYSTILHEDLEK